jgi:hypothetical protein
MKRSLLIFAGMLLVTFAVGLQTASAQENATRLIKQLEDDSDRFSNSVTKALDNSRFDGSSTEDQLIRYVRDFEDSIDRLKKGWDNGEDPTLLAKEVQTRAKAIDKFLKKYPLGGDVKTDWGTVRSDLIRLKNTKMIKTS